MYRRERESERRVVKCVTVINKNTVLILVIIEREDIYSDSY